MAASDTTKQHFPYAVLGQEKTQTFDGAGHFLTIWRITVEDLTHHNRFTVEVPAVEYTPERVDEVVEAELEKVVQTHELGEAPHPGNLAE